ncbi:MAG: serine/threonine-protein kinase [Syntrophobacteraceae bacterium]|nr:serine/threonine-protein kinase [Syntrophobacteraceae bacterium]
MVDQVIGNYKILEKIGEGGMGEVFRGLDTMLEREVAIKSLRPELSRREDIVTRFRSEAVALGRLNHPNIAMVYNFLLHGDQYYMVLEFARGQTLDTVIARRGAIPWRECIPILCQALEGLEHAHRLGVVHRDIKPSNLMLTSSQTVKLMDFGIARILQRARLTRTGHMVGTLEYMSPEHIQGQETDARADIYSLGVVGYEALTGHTPFQRSTDYEIIRAQIEERPTEIRLLREDIPEEVEKSIAKALEKSADNRHQSAAEFLSSLQEAMAAAGAGAPLTRTVRTSPETRLAIDPVYGATSEFHNGAPQTSFASTLDYSRQTTVDGGREGGQKSNLSLFSNTKFLAACASIVVIAAALVFVGPSVYNHIKGPAGPGPEQLTNVGLDNSRQLNQYLIKKNAQTELTDMEYSFRMGTASAYLVKNETATLHTAEEFVNVPDVDPPIRKQMQKKISQLKLAINHNMEVYAGQLQNLHKASGVTPENVKAAFDKVIDGEESDTAKVEMTKLMWSHLQKYDKTDKDTWKSEIVTQSDK